MLDYRTVGPAGCRTNGLSDYSYALFALLKMIACCLDLSITCGIESNIQIQHGKYIYTNKNLLPVYSLKLPLNSGAPVSFPFHRELMLFTCVYALIVFLNVDVRFLFLGAFICHWMLVLGCSFDFSYFLSCL